MFAKLCAVVTLLCACASAITLMDTLARASSAPQQAAGAAMAIAFCVIPYVFTRSVEILGTTKVEVVSMPNYAQASVDRGVPAEPRLAT